MSMKSTPQLTSDFGDRAKVQRLNRIIVKLEKAVIDLYRDAKARGERYPLSEFIQEEVPEVINDALWQANLNTQ